MRSPSNLVAHTDVMVKTAVTAGTSVIGARHRAAMTPTCSRAPSSSTTPAYASYPSSRNSLSDGYASCRPSGMQTKRRPANASEGVSRTSSGPTGRAAPSRPHDATTRASAPKPRPASITNVLVAPVSSPSRWTSAVSPPLGAPASTAANPRMRVASASSTMMIAPPSAPPVMRRGAMSRVMSETWPSAMRSLKWRSNSGFASSARALITVQRSVPSWTWRRGDSPGPGVNNEAAGTLCMPTAPSSVSRSAGMESESRRTCSAGRTDCSRPSLAG